MIVVCSGVESRGFLEGFAAVAAEAVGGIVGVGAAGAGEGIGGWGVIEGDDAGDAADLSQEEIPEAEDEGGGGDYKECVGGDGAEGGFRTEVEGGEDGGAEDEPAGDGGQDGAGEHPAGEAVGGAAFAYDGRGEADIVGMDQVAPE